ncbi:cytochrome c3 family protein [Desulfocurvus sp. DL9XJH121]
MTVAVLLAVALFGYAAPPALPDVPPRVIFDNSGGRVFFNHAGHAEDYGYACEDCHHDGVENARPQPCGHCHPKEFGKSFARSHQNWFPSKEYCGRCHDSEPKPGMAEGERPDKDMIPLQADALHAQCMGCHESVDAGPFGDDSCNTCHAK